MPNGVVTYDDDDALVSNRAAGGSRAVVGTATIRGGAMTPVGAGAFITSIGPDAEDKTASIGGEDEAHADGANCGATRDKVRISSCGEARIVLEDGANEDAEAHSFPPFHSKCTVNFYFSLF